MGIVNLHWHFQRLTIFDEWWFTSPPWQSRTMIVSNFPHVAHYTSSSHYNIHIALPTPVSAKCDSQNLSLLARWVEYTSRLLHCLFSPPSSTWWRLSSKMFLMEPYLPASHLVDCKISLHHPQAICSDIVCGIRSSSGRPCFSSRMSHPPVHKPCRFEWLSSSWKQFLVSFSASWPVTY